jgi:hypothetical protein
MGLQLVVPLTIIPIIVPFIYGIRIPALIILCIGCVDDVLLNAAFGTFALLYSAIAYFISLKGVRFDRPKLYISIAIVLYTISNILFSP